MAGGYDQYVVEEVEYVPPVGGDQLQQWDGGRGRGRGRRGGGAGGGGRGTRGRGARGRGGGGGGGRGGVCRFDQNCTREDCTRLHSVPRCSDGVECTNYVCPNRHPAAWRRPQQPAQPPAPAPEAAPAPAHATAPSPSPPPPQAQPPPPAGPLPCAHGAECTDTETCGGWHPNAVCERGAQCVEPGCPSRHPAVVQPAATASATTEPTTVAATTTTSKSKAYPIPTPGGITKDATQTVVSGAPNAPWPFPTSVMAETDTIEVIRRSSSARGCALPVGAEYVTAGLVFHRMAVSETGMSVGSSDVLLRVDPNGYSRLLCGMRSAEDADALDTATRAFAQSAGHGMVDTSLLRGTLRMALAPDLDMEDEGIAALPRVVLLWCRSARTAIYFVDLSTLTSTMQETVGMLPMRQRMLRNPFQGSFRLEWVEQNAAMQGAASTSRSGNASAVWVLEPLLVRCLQDEEVQQDCFMPQPLDVEDIMDDLDAMVSHHDTVAQRTARRIRLGKSAAPSTLPAGVEAADTTPSAPIPTTTSLHLSRIQYFCARAMQLRDAPPEMVHEHARLFHLELAQFRKACPIYSFKSDMLALLKDPHCQSVVVHVGFDLSPALMLPQWLLDDVYFARGLYQEWIAVLVSSDTTARHMAEHMASMRSMRGVGAGMSAAMSMSTLSSLVTGDVGVVGDDVALSPAARIVVMTYEYFVESWGGCPQFDAWSAVILAEQPEAHPDALDVLLPRLVHTCASKQDFKVISLISDTARDGAVAIDSALAAQSIRGATFDKAANVVHPVQVDWLHPASCSPGSLPEDVVAMHAVNAFSSDVQLGNLVVFVSSAAEVQRVVDALECTLKPESLSHAVLVGLDADMTHGERLFVQHFGEADYCPETQNKRLVCVATEVALYGLHVPHVTTVLDTGRRVVHEYDAASDRTVARSEWISKVSHRWRLGLAGRGGPGGCLRCLYTEEQLVREFPEHDVRPAHAHVSLEEQMLSMLSVGTDLQDLHMFTWPLQAPLSSAQGGLQALDAALEAPVEHDPGLESGVGGHSDAFQPDAQTAAQTGGGKAGTDDVPAAAASGASDGPSGTATSTFMQWQVTATGEAMTYLLAATGLPMARCIVAAAESQTCVAELATIACLSRAAPTGLIDRTSLAGRVSGPMLSCSTGDHETLLNVFRQWLASGRSSTWCREMGVSRFALERAEMLFGRVQRGLSLCGLSMRCLSRGSTSEAIRRALCAGLFRQLGFALDPLTIVRDGVVLAKHLVASTAFDATPVARPADSSVYGALANCGPVAAVAGGVRCVVYSGLVCANDAQNPGGVCLQHVTQIDDIAWVPPAGVQWFTASLGAGLAELARDCVEVPLPQDVFAEWLGGGPVKLHAQCIMQTFPQSVISVRRGTGAMARICGRAVDLPALAAAVQQLVDSSALVTHNVQAANLSPAMQLHLGNACAITDMSEHIKERFRAHTVIMSATADPSDSRGLFTVTLRTHNSVAAEAVEYLAQLLQQLP